MKTLYILGLALFLAACSGDTQSDTETAANDAVESAQNTIDKAAEIAEEKAKMLPVGQEIELSGMMGCGHCNYQIGSSCSAALQTADGTVVILDGVSKESDLYKDRMDQEQMTLKGVVSYDGDQAHLTMSADM